METQDQQLRMSEYSSDWQPSLSGVCAKTTPNREGSPLESSGPAAAVSRQ